MIFTTDQLGRKIKLSSAPKRIVSLVPSISELIWDLSLQNELAGITKFCIHPEKMFLTKTRVGGTKNIAIEKITSIQPDFIIGNKEENTKNDIEALEKLFPVWMSDVNTIEDALDMIRQLGIITDRKAESETIIHKIQENKRAAFSGLKVIYLIWMDPVYAAGKNTFIDSMINAAGFENLITGNRYPELSLEKIKELNPDYLFLSSEPYPFSEKHFDYFSQILPSEKIKIVDGEMFSWYGSRMVEAFNYFRQLKKDLKS